MRKNFQGGIMTAIVLAGAAAMPASVSAAVKAYVTNGGSNTVSEIDVASNSVARTFNVGTAPVGIGADTVNNLLYVANSGSSSVTRIDADSGATTALNLAGSIPEDVAVSPDGSLVFVSSLENATSGTATAGVVYVIDANTFTTTDTVLVKDDPEGLVISEDGHQLWIASDLEIQEIDLQAGIGSLTAIKVISGIDGTDDFEGVAVVTNKSTLFTTNRIPGRVEVVSLSTELIIDTVTTESDPEEVMIRPGSDEVHVSNQGANSITVFSQSSYTPLTTINLSLSEPRGLDFTPDGSTGYVVMGGSNAVIYYDANTKSESGTISVGSQPEDIVIFDVTTLTKAQDWNLYN